MKRIIVAFLTIVLSLAPFKTIFSQTNQKTDNITATITKNTSEEQLKDLKKYFEDNGIKVDVKNTNRNGNDEIIGLSVEIKKESQQNSYNLNSSNPIDDLELGYKEGTVFIESKTDSFAFGNNNSLQSLLNDFNKINNQSLDSILSQNQFSFSFGSEDIKKLLENPSFNLNDIQNQFFNHFFNNNSDAAASNSKSDSRKKSIPKYSFFNLKENKLIIINGQESNYETLKSLAEQDKLTDVDNLKPSTAISIYGNKAKNGAIIAISK